MKNTPLNFGRACLMAASLVLAGATAQAEPSTGSKAENGFASWYGHKPTGGTKTASGERYDPAKFTAAHRTLRFGTRVRVTNLRNGKTVIVRINDRGPFVKGRIIDLSKAAAEQIHMTRSGLVKVRVEVVKTE